MTVTISASTVGALRPTELPDWQIQEARRFSAVNEIDRRQYFTNGAPRGSENHYLRCLREGEPYFLTLEIEKLLTDALETFPDDFDPPPPCPTGILWLENKVEVSAGLTRAFLWHGPDYIVTYGHYGGGAEVPEPSDTDIKLLHSFWWFLTQPLAAVLVQRGDRPQQRRAEREGHADPVIKIVQLRTFHRAPSEDEAEHTHGGYSCRWLVRGHWRQQWYPSQSANLPIWITPYIKGPATAPLKRPTTQIFVVNR